MTSRILAVDFSFTACGWCVYTPETDYITGVNKYPATQRDKNYPCKKDQWGNAERFNNLYRDMKSAVQNHGIKTLVVEHNNMRDRSDANSQAAFGSAAVMQMLCLHMRIARPIVYTSAKWRSINWGDQNKRAPKGVTDTRAWLKARSIQKVHELGYPSITNDDEAEALLLCRAHRIVTEPSFAFECGQSSRVEQELLI